MADTGSDAEKDAETFVSWTEFLGSPYAASLALVCLSVWLHAADSLIVATMLPSIVAEIGGAALVGWSVSLYEIGSIVAGATSALLTMRFGLRAPMSMAAALFGFGCILSAASSTMPLLLTGRALQGLGGGGLVAMGFVAIGLIFPRRYIARVWRPFRPFGESRRSPGRWLAASSWNMRPGVGASPSLPARHSSSPSGSSCETAMTRHNLLLALPRFPAGVCPC